MCTETKQPHKHIELIIAWARGEKIQSSSNKIHWVDVEFPVWENTHKYRIKPIPKPDVVSYACVQGTEKWGRPEIYCSSSFNWNEGGDGPFYTRRANVKFVVDGETGKLKSVSLL